MTLLAALAVLISLLLISWAPLNVLCWLIVCSRSEPFNWRVVLGPRAYHAWLDRGAR